MVTPNPNAFLGQSSITGGGYVFATNTTSLLTNSDPNQWFGIGAANNTTWTQPSARSEFWAKWVEIIFGDMPLAVRCQAFPTQRFGFGAIPTTPTMQICHSDFFYRSTRHHAGS